MRRPRRGIALPVVLATVVVLALLSALALFDGLQEARAAAFAGDQARAEAAMWEGLDAAAMPPDLPALCRAAPLAPQHRLGTAASGGRFRVLWVHAGGGRVRVLIDGEGRQGGRVGAVGWMRPDSGFRVADGCVRSLRLLPAGPRWLAAVPGG
ncbi:MAG: hypothetical protein K1X31_00230 [Gemmatimonadaceae bacterium]|nr:hypothetical protein [Gemmatimonadaceae bacterium]